MIRQRAATKLLAESWQCGKCDAHFITFCTGDNLGLAHRPDQIACPYCHYVGRFRHWEAELAPGRHLEELFPWPESRNFDTEDAEQLQRLLALSAPSAREDYQETDVTPWQLDERPQPTFIPATKEGLERLRAEMKEKRRRIRATEKPRLP